MHTVVDFTIIMPDAQEEINEYIKKNYSTFFPYKGKSYYSIENDEYTGPDEVIEDIKKIQNQFPDRVFEVHGSVKFADSGEYCDYKYYISKKGEIRFVQTPFYQRIEDISDYDTAEELLDSYPWLGQSFDEKALQKWINKKVETVYYWDDVMSEAPPDSFFDEEGNIDPSTQDQKNDSLVSDELCQENAILDPYIDYVRKKVPFEEFLRLFSISKGLLEESDYYEWIDEMLADGNIYNCDYDDFCEWLTIEPDFPEEDFPEVLEKLKKIEIKDRTEFEAGVFSPCGD